VYNCIYFLKHFTQDPTFTSYTPVVFDINVYYFKSHVDAAAAAVVVVV
jgi:hypothetical protein